MSLKINETTQISVESVYGDGGSSFTSVPVFYGTKPTVKSTMKERQLYQGSLAPSSKIATLLSYEATLNFFLKGSGTAGTAPELGPLLRMCGLSETIVASTSVTYAPRDSSFESFTLKHNLDGILHELKGARGSLQITLKPGDPIACQAKVGALYTRPTTASISAPTFANAAVAYPIVTGMGLTIGGNTYKLAELVLKLEQDLKWRESINAANTFGMDEYYIGSRKFTIDFKMVRDSSNQIINYTDLETSAQIAIATSTGLGSAGNLISLAAANAQFIKNDVEDQGDEQGYAGTLAINYTSSDASEFALTFA
jgi:hypothetical protein